MRSLQASTTNDLVVGADGRLSVVDSLAAVETVARTHMQTRRGEMIHAMQQGIPFDPIVWSGIPNLAQFEAASRARLLSIPGVREVTQFDATLRGDTLEYGATLLTDFGEVTIDG